MANGPNIFQMLLVIIIIIIIISTEGLARFIITRKGSLELGKECTWCGRFVKLVSFKFQARRERQ